MRIKMLLACPLVGVTSMIRKEEREEICCHKIVEQGSHVALLVPAARKAVIVST
jgi:hypothetical protein